MASLYKKPIRITDPKTGQKVNAKSKKWWGRYRDAQGVERRVPLATDRTAAQSMLNQIVRRAELEAAGCRDLFDDHAKTPLAKHIEAFECFLRGKGNTEKHVRDSATKISRTFWRTRITTGGSPTSIPTDTRSSRTRNGPGYHRASPRPWPGIPTSG
jgi:hypothetical protein